MRVEKRSLTMASGKPWETFGSGGGVQITMVGLTGWGGSGGSQYRPRVQGAGSKGKIYNTIVLFFSLIIKVIFICYIKSE